MGGTDGAPDPTILVGLATEAHAQEAADTLNGLVDNGREDEVLGRMLRIRVAIS